MPADTSSALHPRPAAPAIESGAVAEPSPPRDTEWEPEPRPAFLELARDAAFLWAQQPLLWVLLLTPANALGLFLTGSLVTHRGLGAVTWVALFGVALPLLVAAMVSQSRQGEPAPDGWAKLLRAASRGAAFSLSYSLATLGFFCPALARHTRFPLEGVLLGGLFATAPFHALLAPALMLACAEGLRGRAAAAAAFRLANRRTWLHLGLLLALGAALAWVVAVWNASGAAPLRGQSPLLTGAVTALLLSVGQTLWTAVVVVSGLDALAQRPAEDRAT
jgi:hypothetical protein